MKARLQEYALIAEIIGGLAVILTLLALLLELGANTRATQAQTAQGVWNNLLQANFEIVRDESQQELFRGALFTQLEGINSIENRTARNIFERYMLIYDNAYYQYRQGTLDEDVFSRFRAPIERRVRLKGFPEYWEARKDGFSLSFREYIDELLVTLR